MKILRPHKPRFEREKMGASSEFRQRGREDLKIEMTAMLAI